MQNLFVMVDMRVTRLWIAVAAFLLVVIVVVVPGFEWRTPAERAFSMDREEQPVCVKLKKQGQEAVILEKRTAGQWVVDANYLADDRAIEDLHAAFRFMEVRRPVPSEYRQQVMQELDEQGVRVQVYVRRHWLNFPGGVQLFPRQQLLRDYLILPGNDADAGTMMRMAHTDMPYDVHLPGLPVNLHQLFIPEAAFWRTPYVADFSLAEIAEVTARVRDRQSESYTWQVDGAEELLLFNQAGERIPQDQINTDQLAAYFHQIRRLRYERLLSGTADQPPGDLLTGEAFFTVVIHDIYGNSTKLDFFKRMAPDDGTLVPGYKSYDPNRFYLQVNEGDYALAEYVIFQPAIRPLSWFLKNADHSFSFFE